jgi:hypothetical protein
MPNVYIEARPKGRQEGSAVEDFMVEDNADHVLAAFKDAARSDRMGGGRTTIRLSLLAVRHLNDKKVPDHWRAP